MSIQGTVRIAAVVVAMTFASLSPAATITGANTTGGPIPSSGEIGTVTFDIIISAPTPGATITGITVNVDMFHERSGNLRITLSNLATGVVADLVYRVSSVDGINAGDNSNFDGVYSFNDAFTASLWDAAEGATGNNAIVPGGNYGASTINDVDVSLDGEFNGTLVDGTWQLTIFDIVDNDSGTLRGWDLVIDYNEGLPPVPEPATLLLFGLGLGALASLRKRQ